VNPVISAAAEHAQFVIALGDLPTWIAAGGGLIAAAVVVRQLGMQQTDRSRQTAQLERQLANGVDAIWTPAGNVLILTTPLGSVPTQDRAVIVVTNKCPRPIRHVTARIELENGRVLRPLMAGVMTDNEDLSRYDYRMFNPDQRTEIPMIRPTYMYGFIFEYTIPADDPAHPERTTARPIARFTDDTDLTWELDGDLRLRKIKPRLTWQGLMPPDPGGRQLGGQS
jgi:hypothetical protein